MLSRLSTISLVRSMGLLYNRSAILDEGAMIEYEWFIALLEITSLRYVKCCERSHVACSDTDRRISN
jgi:hypothetical protein